MNSTVLKASWHVTTSHSSCFSFKHVFACLKTKPTSLRDATALWSGVNHMLSLALTRAPKMK